jgi:hypothetical protein
MKKYFFGAAALVLAIAFSAFTSPKFANRTFVYSPTGLDAGTFDEDAVEKSENWLLTTVACVQESQERACSFVLDIPAGQESNFYNTTTGRLKPLSGSIGVQIFASALDANNAYVTDVQKTGSVSIDTDIDNIDMP